MAGKYEEIRFCTKVGKYESMKVKTNSTAYFPIHYSFLTSHLLTFPPFTLRRSRTFPPPHLAAQPHFPTLL